MALFANRQTFENFAAMTQKEALYKYLSGGISNRSFRKWLLHLDNNDGFFSDTDFVLLKEQAVTYSNPKRIKDMLYHYVDRAIVEQLILSTRFKHLVDGDQDVLNKLDELERLGKQTGDKKIIDFVAPFKALFQNTPRLNERKNWNEKIFLEKRQVVEKHRKNIMRGIAEFTEIYHVDYREAIKNGINRANPQRGFVSRMMELFFSYFKK